MQPALMTAVYAIMLGVYFKVTPEPGDPSGIDTFAFFLLAGRAAVELLRRIAHDVDGHDRRRRRTHDQGVVPAAAAAALLDPRTRSFAVHRARDPHGRRSSVFERKFLFHLLPVTLLLVVLLVLFTSGIAFWLAACNVQVSRCRVPHRRAAARLLLSDADHLLRDVRPRYTGVRNLDDVARHRAGESRWRGSRWHFDNVLYDVRLPGLPRCCGSSAGRWSAPTSERASSFAAQIASRS